MAGKLRTPSSGLPNKEAALRWLYSSACFPSYSYDYPQEGLFTADRKPLPVMGRVSGHFRVLMVFTESTLVVEGSTTYNRTPIVNPPTGENIEPLVRAYEGGISLGRYLAGYADVDNDGVLDCIDPEITPTADNVDGDFMPDRFDPDLQVDHKPYIWMYAPKPLTEKTHFAQLANGDSWTSSILLANPSRTLAATGYLSFFNDAGLPAAVSMASTPGTAMVSFASFTISPLGSVVFTSSGTGPLNTGSIRVSSDSILSGMTRLSHPAVGIVGVDQSMPLTSLMIPVVRGNGTNSETGIAISNPLSTPARVLFSLRGLEGNEIPGGSLYVDLAPSGHDSKFARQLYPDLVGENFQGTLIATAAGSGAKITATALQLGAVAGEFAALAVVAVDPAPTDSTLYFAYYVNGSAGVPWSSSISVMNPLTFGNQGELQAYDDDGNRLVEGVRFDLPAKGASSFTADGRGNLVAGSARLISGNAIAGVLRFAAPGVGTAGVGASKPMTASLLRLFAAFAPA